MTIDQVQNIRQYFNRTRSLVMIRYVTTTSQRKHRTARINSLSRYKSFLKPNTLENQSQDSQRVAGVFTLTDSLELRRDAIEHVHPRRSESHDLNLATCLWSLVYDVERVCVDPNC